jgi:hypothetical protein
MLKDSDSNMSVSMSKLFIMMNKCEKSTVITYKFQAFKSSESVWNEGHMVYYFAKKPQAVCHVNFSKYIDATLCKVGS